MLLTRFTYARYMWFFDEGFNMTEKTKKPLPEAAVRALEEAEARRTEQAKQDKIAAEKGGPKGPEPTRYGDWERKGRAVDF